MVHSLVNGKLLVLGNGRMTLPGLLAPLPHKAHEAAVPRLPTAELALLIMAEIGLALTMLGRAQAGLAVHRTVIGSAPDDQPSLRRQARPLPSQRTALPALNPSWLPSQSPSPDERLQPF